MSLPKFLNLFVKSTLYFCQANILKKTDPFEGSLSLPNRQFYENIWSDETFARSTLNLSADKPIPDGLKKFFSVEGRKSFLSMIQKSIYLNCWHMCEHESAFLWSVYASHSDGIAIKSTIHRLKTSFENEQKDILIGHVKYIDYNTAAIPELNIYNPYFFKRQSFEAEKELRACFWQTTLGTEYDTYPSGYDMAINLDTLIEEIVICPVANAWYDDTVKLTLEKLSSTFKIRKSSLSEKEIF